MRRLLVLVAAVGVTFTPAVVALARPSATLAGNDISFPQCGKTYPSGQAFAIVGVNGGKASTFNPCFSSEWGWAQTSTGVVTSQAPAQLYVNTGNPGDVLGQSIDPGGRRIIKKKTDPYGTCSGTWTDNLPCSWEYGYERALADITVVGAAGGKKWWLDIDFSFS